MSICLERIEKFLYYYLVLNLEGMNWFAVILSRYPSRMSLTSSLFYNTTFPNISTFHLCPVITLKDHKSVYLTLTLIDNLEIFQAYGNTADLYVNCETLFKHMHGVVDLEV